MQRISAIAHLNQRNSIVQCLKYEETCIVSFLACCHGWFIWAVAIAHKMRSTFSLLSLISL
ncbi:hypothetical protein [Calothrix sp. PCC 7507]|uniref:hypothetical protein n=1 Tax=Calothrix sp. PCC 7507 TaxID=99598 RepID=UPI001181C735|nr:hypothetical protein [Calothrix sp. PCC 7507]